MTTVKRDFPQAVPGSSVFYTTWIAETGPSFTAPFVVHASGVNCAGTPIALDLKLEPPVKGPTFVTWGGLPSEMDEESRALAADPEVLAMIAEGEEDIRHRRTIPGSELRKRD